jgi:hypothetical protein
MPMEIDRRAFVASIGGVAAASLMSHEDRAEALEHYMIEEIEQQDAQSQPQSGGSIYRKPANARGTGTVFRMDDLEDMPAQPTLIDFYKTRFRSAHVIRSATRALETGQPERTVFACLIHDVTQALVRSDHGWWGGQLFEPYVDERISWAVRYHQALRFFPDPSVGYEYPEMYNRIWGVDYEPDDYIKAAHKDALDHKWYMEARLVTMNDEYGFDRDIPVGPIEDFTDIIGRQFKQPKEGIGYDNSPTAHMWRTLINPNRSL